MAPDATPRDSEHDRLIASLTADLQPVRCLPSPGIMALLWIGLVVATGAALASIADLPALWHRLTAMPDMWLAVLGSIGTSVLAAIAAFQLSMPDRSRAWALLPAPALLLWIGASGMGCLRSTLVGGTHVADLAETRDCLVFIVGFSIPLSAALFLMLRRGYPLQPGLTAALAGLAAAAAAATLLNFFHPYDAAALDLVVHATAVTLVVLASRAFGWLASPT